MDIEKIRAAQAPLKEKYRADPGAARQTLRVEGRVGDNVPSCAMQTHFGEVVAGQHPATGGDGSLACSANMLLEALVGCAGTTLGAVAAAMRIELGDPKVTAEADIDWAGTLGVDKSAPVGLTAVRMKFSFSADAPDEKIAKMIDLTERYCVVYQTLKAGVDVETTVENRK
ncbi:OsmC family protein [bacterium]|nr:OsmC family protein [bacterium]